MIFLNLLSFVCTRFDVSMIECYLYKFPIAFVLLHFQCVCCRKAITLIYMRNDSGPNIDPWGTPDWILRDSDSKFLYFIFCFLLLRYDSKNLIDFSVKWYNFNLRSSILWSTRSNAFLRSRYTVPTYLRTFPSQHLNRNLIYKC